MVKLVEMQSADVVFGVVYCCCDGLPFEVPGMTPQSLCRGT